MIEPVSPEYGLKALTLTQPWASLMALKAKRIETRSWYTGYRGTMDRKLENPKDISEDLRSFVNGRRFGTILVDPPWQFQNRTGKVAPEHARLSRYPTMSLKDIKSLPVVHAAAPVCHLYLWVPNALLPEGLEVMKSWGFQYKSNLIWHKIRKDGGSDGRGVGFYFRNVTEILLFGIRGKNARTLQAGRTQVNYIASRKREHSRKPDEQYPLIESCSPGPHFELFARGSRPGWTAWGNQAMAYAPDWPTYSNHSQAAAGLFTGVVQCMTEFVRPLANLGPVRGELGLWNWAASDQEKAENALPRGEAHL